MRWHARRERFARGTSAELLPCKVYRHQSKLRRHLSEGRDILRSPIGSVMTRKPVSVTDGAYAVDVLRVFERKLKLLRG